jgi:hypothetical protein
MKRQPAVCLILCSVLTLAGCIDTATKIVVKPDGSGTIEKTIILSKHLAELMISMGNKSDPATIEQGMLNEKTLMAGAARMGSGVSFVSAQKITAAKGNGWKALYSFKDIGTVKISQNPAADLTVPGAATTNAAPSDKESFTFTLKKGSPAALSVAFPKPDPNAKSAGGPPAGAATDEKTVASMKQLYSDMRIVLTVEVDGAISQTNATYVNGPDVTLIDMDFAKIIADDATYKKLTSMKNQSMTEVRATVKAVPGILIEDHDPVTITFR